MSKDVTIQNSNETEKRMNSAILKALATTELSHIAPLLSLAREVDAKSSEGMIYSTIVDRVEIKEFKTYKILRIVMATEIKNENFTQKNIGVIYTFRMITQSLFEPFVFISKYKKVRSIFAYVDEQEFLFDSIEGNESEILEKIYKKAIEDGKKILARYIDLIIIGFQKNKL